MDIQKIDKNFAPPDNIAQQDLIWLDVPQAPFSLHGVMYDHGEGRFLRMPQPIADAVSENVARLNAHTSGGRIRFRTDSSYIAIRALMDPFSTMTHMPMTGKAGFDLYEHKDGKDTYFRTFVPPDKWENEYFAAVNTFGRATDFTIHFPLYHGVRKLYVGIKKDALLEEAAPYRHPVPMVFYGSSITQGACASRPGNCYAAILSRRLSADFINLGFSAGGKGELEMAEYISSLDMSVLVMDYDSNAPTPEHLRKTHYAFYKTVRDKQPTLPIILVTHPSALHGVYYKTAAAKTWGTFEERRRIILDTYERAVAAGDKNICFVDGRELFQGEEWDGATVDGIHPNDFGFYRFAMHLEPSLRSMLK